MAVRNMHARVNLKWWAWPVVPLLSIFVDWLWKKAIKGKLKYGRDI